MNGVLKRSAATMTAAAIVAVATGGISAGAAEYDQYWLKSDALVIEIDKTTVPDFDVDGKRVIFSKNSGETVKDATIEDEGEMYSGECYISADGNVTHPEWYEGDKYIKALAEVNGVEQYVYYLVEAEPAPEYYTSTTGSTEFVDYIDIGNVESEDVSEFEMIRVGETQKRTVDGIEYTYRNILHDGSMVLNLKCAPDKINYLTVRLWGGDTGDTILWLCDPVSGYMNTDNTQQPKRNSLVDRRDWVELNYTASTPQYDGGFIYATYEIPEIYTKGRNSVSLRLYSTGGPANYSSPAIKEQKEPSRGIYDVYMTQEAAFVPENHGVSSGSGDNKADNIFELESSYDMDHQRAALATAVQNGVYSFMQWQIYGDGEYPSYMEGMQTRSTDWKNYTPETDDEWKNIYYNDSYMCRQNLTPLNMFELFAYAYRYYDELNIESFITRDELLDRVITGVDFLCRAQGANGGFYSETGGWIGGPYRQDASGNNLTGFGLRSVGEAIIMLFDELDDNIWNEIIDSDADGNADMDRKSAWDKMMSTARDQLVSVDGSGHAPNQDMANIIAALRFDICLSKMGSENAWKSGKVASLLDICFGLEKNTVLSSYWVSEKGTILENFGSVHGGYSGDYGSSAAAEISQLAQIGLDYYGYNYTRYIDNVYSVLNNYYFTGKKLLNGSFVPQQYTEGIISNRNAYYPGTERYIVDLYAALDLENDTALKILSNYITQSDFENLKSNGLGFDTANSHFEDNVIDAVKLLVRFDDVLANTVERDINDYDFIMEDESVSEYAWADEMARNVVIKDGSERIYMALNWRNPLSTNGAYNTEYAKDRQAIKINNLVRVHATNDRYDRYGYADMYTDRYSETEWTNINKGNENSCIQALMITSYGDYTVIMNSYGCGSNGTSRNFSWSDFEETAGLDRAVKYRDLISGKLYQYSGGQWESGGSILEVQSQSTIVLRAEQLKLSKVVYESGTASVSAWNSTGSDVDISMYAAQYDAKGELLCVDYTEAAVKDYSQLSIHITPDENSDNLCIYVWDPAQSAYIEKTEFYL